jgi:hypothetical protein
MKCERHGIVGGKGTLLLAQSVHVHTELISLVSLLRRRLTMIRAVFKDATSSSGVSRGL